jgi:SAM-dependent methyltransferase
LNINNAIASTDVLLSPVLPGAEQTGTWFEAFDPACTSKVTYEHMQFCRPDYRAAIQLLARRARQLVRSSHRAVTCLDVACGTGTAIRAIQEERNVARRIGLDLDADMLVIAAERCPGLELIQGDMVEVELPRRACDLILASFAYHHVENSKKTRFCQRMLGATAPGGRILVLEICLDGQEAIEEYYKAVVAGLAGGAWRDRTTAFMDWTSSPDIEKTREYKVPASYVYDDFHRAGWRHLATTPVWPAGADERRGGCFLFEFDVSRS